jgi:Ohr subfamily peroxiredoxin
MQKLEKALYTARGTAYAGREGRAKSDDGALDVVVSAPKELGGPGKGTNPEQLFACGYAACFGSAIGVVARTQKINTGTFEVTCEVDLGKTSTGFGIAARLKVKFSVLQGDQARSVVAKAHEICPYSNATRNNIDVQIDVV